MKPTLILLMMIIIVKSNEEILESTHYDYQQGIGKIIQNYHYVHFNINITALRETYANIRTSYAILSHRHQLQNSNLLKQTEILIMEISQNLQQIIPTNGRFKRGLLNGIGTAIKYVFGNPDANDLEKINKYLEEYEKQRYEDIITINKTITILNTIGNNMNMNTDVINKNLLNISKTLNGHREEFNIFEAVVTLIIQEQHFLDLINKIRRSFIFSEQIFNLEVLTYDQLQEIKIHLLKIYSQKELIFHYHNLLDFRFTQGSIVCINDSIIYTLKIPILNPIDFSLFQKLATINNNNQTEIITTPWKLTGLLLKLSANKCL